MTTSDMTQDREAIGLPATPAACRERLVRLQDEIASIRTQMATADIRRQAEKRPLDPVGFHRARTALRLKQQELARVKSHLAHLKTHDGNVLSSVSRRQRLQDTLIQVCRAACSDEQWQERLQRAKRLLAEQEGAHG
jgi:hypothetical protein